MSRTGPEISRAQQERRRHPGGGGRRDERQALGTLRTEAGPLWPRLLGMWVFLAGTATLMRVWIGSVGWGEALTYGLIFASFFVAFYGWLNARRRARIRHVADARTLERGTVTARRGPWVQVRGEEHEVTWKTETAIGLSVGDEVYAAPTLAPGERIVLIRLSNTRGLMRDVMGPRGEAVLAETGSP